MWAMGNGQWAAHMPNVGRFVLATRSVGIHFSGVTEAEGREPATSTLDRLDQFEITNRALGQLDRRKLISVTDQIRARFPADLRD